MWQGRQLPPDLEAWRGRSPRSSRATHVDRHDIVIIALANHLGVDPLDSSRTVADLQRLVEQAPASSADEPELGAPVTSSLREEVRRAPRRTRRNWVHRQTRRTLRGHAA